jgi:CRP-like cAMP-binding protein
LIYVFSGHEDAEQVRNPSLLPSNWENSFARKLSAAVSLSEKDLAIISDLYRRRRRFLAGQELIHQGQTEKTVFVLFSGWAFSYKVQASGSRQIVDFQIPGDLMGLRSTMFDVVDQSVETITPIQASLFSCQELEEWAQESPRLARAVQWAAARDGAVVVERLVDLGRRSATERVAHFLLELAARLRLVGLADSSSFSFPLSQYLLADALGLSAVHANRVLRQLREGGLVTFQSGTVVFDNYEGLVECASFDQTYLDQDRPLLR